MKLTTIQKFGGVAIIAGSILLTCWTIIWSSFLPINEITKDFSILVLNQNWTWVTSLAFLATILMIFGFTAVYSKIYNRAGFIGFVGFVLIILAYIFQTILTSWELFLYPTIVHHGASIFLIRDKIILFSTRFQLFRIALEIAIFLGVLFFCLALYRTKIFPKISGVLIFCGSIIYAVSQLFNVYIEISGVVILSVGSFLLGYNLIKNPENQVNK
jgi:hypothetical protein